MNTSTTHAATLWPLLVYVAAAVAVVAIMLAVGWVLGERHHRPAADEPFESGIVPAAHTAARLRFSAKFYLVAMFFVIFDVEAVFIYAWAAAFREVGWAGYVEMLVFVVVLGAALAYLWLLGALDWGARRAPAKPHAAPAHAAPAHAEPAHAAPAHAGPGHAAAGVEPR